MTRWLKGSASLAVLAGLWTSLGSAAQAMSSYQWKKRPLVVFAASPGDEALARQRAIVKSLRPAFIDRKVVVIYVEGDRVSADLGAPPGQSAAALRQRYGVGDGQFRVVLVGLDGGVKLTSSGPLSGEKLFATIDTMPMRRDEVRR